MSSYSYDQLNLLSVPQKIGGYKSYSFGSTNQRVFYHLHRNIYISDFETCRKLCMQLKKNVHILDVRSTIDDNHIRSLLYPNIYRSVNMNSSGRCTDLYECLPLCFDFITTNQNMQPVIICCETGTNQSVIVGLAYLVIVCQNSLEMSVKHLKKNSIVHYKSSSLLHNDIDRINHPEFLSLTVLKKVCLSLDPDIYHLPNPNPEYLGQLFCLELNFCSKNSYSNLTGLFIDVYGPDAVMVNTSKSLLTQDTFFPKINQTENHIIKNTHPNYPSFFNPMKI